MKDRTIVAMVIVICITAIQITAFIMQVNGQVLTLTTNVIMLVGGAYFVTRERAKTKGET